MSASGTVGRPLPSVAAWLADRRERFDALVMDIDGVLVLGRRALPGSRELLDLLGASGMPFSLLTNAVNMSVEQRLRRLHEAGLSVEPGRIVSSGHALEGYVRENRLAGRLLFLMGSLGAPGYAEAAGLRLTRNPGDLARCDGVLLGEGRYDVQSAVNSAVSFLRLNPAAPVVCPNPDIFYPASDGSFRAGSGAVAGLMELVLRTCGCPSRIIYLGKPHAPIFRHNHRRLEQAAGRSLPRDRVLMLGDSLHGDIRGGADFGYRTALVLTGATTLEALRDQAEGDGAVRPDHVFARL